MPKQVVKLLCMTLSILILTLPLGACKESSDNTDAQKTSAKTTGTTPASAKSSTASSAKATGSAAKNSSTAANTTATNKTGDTTPAVGSEQQSSQSGDSQGEALQPEITQNNDTPVSAGPVEEVIDLKGRKFIFADRAAEPFADFSEAEKKFNFTLEWKYIPGDTSVIANDYVNSAMAGVVFADSLVLQSKTAFPRISDNNLIAPIDDYIDFQNDPLFSTNYLRTSGFWRGKHYGYLVPVQPAGYVLYYNRDMFAREGLPDPRDLVDTGTWDWDAFLQAAITTTKDFNSDGIVDQWGVQMYNVDSAGDAFIFSNGANHVEEIDGRFTFVLDSPASVKALQFINDLSNVYKVMLYKPAVTFLNGGVSMLVGSMLAHGNKFFPATFNYGMVPMPKGPDASGYSVVNDSCTLVCYPSNANVKEAVAVMKEVLVDWDAAKPNYISFEERALNYATTRLKDPRDIELAVTMFMDPTQLQFMAFQDVWKMITKEVYQKIINMDTTPAAALDSIRVPAQTIIDDIIGQ